MTVGLMPPGCRAKVLANGVERAVDKPFVESLHDELGGEVATDVVLEGDVPCEVLQVCLGDDCL